MSAVLRPRMPAPAGGIALSRDDVISRALLVVIVLVLVTGLLLPLGTMLLRSIEDNQGRFVGLVHFTSFLATPSLKQSIWNSIWVSSAVVAISVPAAFLFAYALTRSRMPFKGGLRLIALVPLLVLSLLSPISLIQWFVNQRLLKPLLGATTIYGPLGVILAQVFNTFPHALMILVTALTLADARLYEAADALGTSRWRKFLTITLPSCKYGLISAATVVFTYVVSDFGAPKVIGGNFNLLAVDVFKLVVGQQDFSRGAVVGLLLLVPSVAAFAIDWAAQRRQQAQLSARSVPFVPRRRTLFDTLMFIYCALVCIALLAVLGMAIYASFIRLWPYNLTFTLRHYDFALVQGDLAHAYFNSLRMALGTAIAGTVTVFVGAYLIEKTRGLAAVRPVIRFLAMISMAVPGLVLGLGYIMFFNHPANPLNVLYGTMTILVVNTVIHFYTSGHLTAVTALKSLDGEFEAVSASLKVPFYKTFVRVTVPVCLPAILDIGRYYFVVAMATLSSVVFLYSPDTILAAVAIMHLDEAGEIGPAAALATLIVTTSAGVCLVYAALTRWMLAKTQGWRTA